MHPGAPTCVTQMLVSVWKSGLVQMQVDIDTPTIGIISSFIVLLPTMFRSASLVLSSQGFI